MLNGSFMGTGLAMLGAAMVLACGCIGSARGVGLVGETASGVLTVKEDLFSRALVLQVVPGTQALNGVVICFYALLRLGFFDGTVATMSTEDGFKFFASCLPMAFGGLSAIYQGRICADAVVSLAKHAEGLAKNLLMAIMVEFFSILTLLATFMMMNRF